MINKKWLGILTLVSILGVIVISCGSTPPTFQGNLSGTYTYGSNASITFSGNSYTLRVGDNTYRGSYSVSRNTFRLAGHGSTTNWIRGTWTIVDLDTIRDADNDLWRRAQASSPTGTYVFSSDDSITFSGNNYTLRTSSNTYTGTFSLSGNMLTLAGHGSTINWIRGVWTIVDSNSIRDSDGDEWIKQQGTSTSVGQHEEVTFVNETGETIFYLNMSLRADTSWGGDWLGDNVIIDGGTYTVRLLPGEYDVRVRDRNENNIREFWIEVKSGDSHLFKITRNN